MSLPDLDLNDIQEWLQQATGIEGGDKQLAFLAIATVTTVVQSNTVIALEAIGLIKAVIGIEEE